MGGMRSGLKLMLESGAIKKVDPNSKKAMEVALKGIEMIEQGETVPSASKKTIIDKSTANKKTTAKSVGPSKSRSRNRGGGGTIMESTGLLSGK
tara:strand:+ start:382 stop:663 length:282 start_codon:yes stop_codon:yes gene_type:complete